MAGFLDGLREPLILCTGDLLKAGGEPTLDARDGTGNKCYAQGWSSRDWV